MDPASAIIGIVSFGLTVFKEINEIRKDFKDAPEQLQALKDECIGIEILLDTLGAVSPEAVPKSPRTVAHLSRLSDKARGRLEEVREMTRKITSQANLDKVTFGRWFTKRGDLKEMSQKLKDLRETLELMLHCINQNSLQFLIAVKIDSVDRRIGVKPSVFPQETTAPMSTHCPRRRGPLQCPSNCICRCHARSLHPVVPQSAVPYLGQLFVSPRILDWITLDPLGRCNVETCRATLLQPAKVAYIFPRIPFYGSFQGTPFDRVHLSLNAYRTVPDSSPIKQAIWSADVCRVRDLFAKQQASVWDVDARGKSILALACELWQAFPTEDDRLEIVRFLVEAGADALLYAETETTSSAHDILVIRLLTHLVGEHEPGRSFRATIQTNPIAIAVFRSIFNTDALDALQDFLSHRFRHSYEDTARLLESLETTEYAVARSSLFNAIRYTPLQYAIQFSPSSVESLLAEGADVAAEPTLAYAARYGSDDLMELLINNGADVNMEHKGRTALHWACHKCYYSTFFDLVQCAEDEIDWDARTPEGQDALDLFEMGVSKGDAWDLTSEQICEFRSTIVSHMDPSQFRVVEDVPLDIPGAFPLDT